MNREAHAPFCERPAVKSRRPTHLCNVSNALPLSATPCSRTSHTPDSHQRRNCRQIEFQLPNASGRSRHGAPVRQIHRIPSHTRRWFAGGRPPRNEGMVMKGPTIAHSSSVIKPRSTANLHVKRPASNHTAWCRGNPPQKKDQIRISIGPGRFFMTNRPGGSEFFVTFLCRSPCSRASSRAGYGFVHRA